MSKKDEAPAPVHPYVRSVREQYLVALVKIRKAGKRQEDAGRANDEGKGRPPEPTD